MWALDLAHRRQRHASLLWKAVGGGVAKASCTTSVAVASEELEACVQPEQVSTALGDALRSQYWSVPAAQKGFFCQHPWTCCTASST